MIKKIYILTSFLNGKICYVTSWQKYSDTPCKHIKLQHKIQKWGTLRFRSLKLNNTREYISQSCSRILGCNFKMYRFNMQQQDKGQCFEDWYWTRFYNRFFPALSPKPPQRKRANRWKKKTTRERMKTTWRISLSYSHLCIWKFGDVPDLMGDNSSGRWELWDTSLFIPFDDCAANSISKAAKRSRTARIQSLD